MKSITPILCVTVLVVLGLLAGRAWAQVNVGDKPVVNWKTTENQAVTNAVLAGRIVIIDFWATWCGPCMAEADHMVALNKEYGPQGVAMLGIGLDRSAAQMAPVAKEKGFSWPQVCSGQAWNDPIAKQWGVTGIPRTFILGPDGTVLWQGHPAQIDRPLGEALKKHPPTVTLTKQALDNLAQAGKHLDKKEYNEALTLVETLTDALATDRAVTDALRTLGTRMKAATADKDKVQEALAAHPQAKARLTKLVPTLTAAPGGGGPGPTGDAATQPAANTGGAAGSARKAAPALLQSKLEAADKAREAGKQAEAYELYKWIVERGAADSPAVQAATPQVAKYEADPAFMVAYKKAQAQEAARRLLSLGKNYEDAGRADLAKEQYRKVVEGYADTPAAEEAKKRLGALK